MLQRTYGCSTPSKMARSPVSLVSTVPSISMAPPLATQLSSHAALYAGIEYNSQQQRASILRSQEFHVIEQTSSDASDAYAAPPTGASAPTFHWRRLWPGGVALLVALYCGLWNLAARLPLNRTDLDAFFVPASRIALSGHPFDVYSLRYVVKYPNANGPISLIPLTFASAIAAWLGVLDDMMLRRVVVLTIFAPFVLLMAREAVAAVDQLRDRRLTGFWRFAAYAVFALSPEVWHGMLFYGHIEQPIMLWLALWGIRQLSARRPARAGLLLGLALLTRSSALMLVLPLAALLARDREWRGPGALRPGARGHRGRGAAAISAGGSQRCHLFARHLPWPASGWRWELLGPHSLHTAGILRPALRWADRLAGIAAAHRHCAAASPRF